MILDEKKYAIGGLPVHIHGLSTLSKSTPIAILFLLHGRGGTKEDFDEAIGNINLPALNSRENVKTELHVVVRLD